MGASLSLGCTRPSPQLGGQSDAPEYAGSPNLPLLGPEALTRLGAEPAPAPSASAAAPKAAPLIIPRLPGTPELTADGYRLAGGGLEVLLGKQLLWQVQSITLDGQSCLVPSDRLGVWAAAGSFEAFDAAHVAGRATYDVTVEGSTLLVQGGPEGGAFRSSKRYRLDTARRALEITFGFENTGSEPLQLTSEQYFRVPSAGSLVFAPITKGSEGAKGTLKLHAWQSLLWFAPASPIAADQWGNVQASDGWLAAVSGRSLLAATFTDAPKGEQGHTLTLTTNVGRPNASAPTTDELRVSVGGRLLLPPGAKLSFSTRWLVRQLPANIAIKPGNAELLGFARGVMQ